MYVVVFRLQCSNIALLSLGVGGTAPAPAPAPATTPSARTGASGSGLSDFGEMDAALDTISTGLATVTVHRREERIMAGCHSPIESEDTYYRRCLPIKLRLDSIYAERRNLRLDVFILWRTFARLDPGFAPLRDFYAEWFSHSKQPLRPATA